MVATDTINPSQHSANKQKWVNRPQQQACCQLQCSQCPSHLKNIFAALPATQLQTISQHKMTHSYARGHRLYHEGEKLTGLYCIAHGAVKLYKHGEEGSDVILGIASDGDILGLRALFTDQRHHLTAEVISPSQICHINQNVISLLITEAPHIALQLLHQLGSKLSATEELLSDMLNKDVHRRFSHLLLALSKTHGKQHLQGTRINLRLSRMELAAMLGVRPETVTRLLSEYKAAGYLLLPGKDIIITNLKALADEAKL